MINFFKLSIVKYPFLIYFVWLVGKSLLVFCSKQDHSTMLFACYDVIIEGTNSFGLLLITLIWGAATVFFVIMIGVAASWICESLYERTLEEFYELKKEKFNPWCVSCFMLLGLVIILQYYINHV